MPEETRVTINVEVPRGTQQKLRDYCEKHGLIQRHLMGALIETFLSAHDVVKRILRRDVDETMRPAYAEALEQLCKELRTSTTAPYLDITPSPPQAPDAHQHARKRHARP
jgi:CRP-like cAMP-binding protein